MACSIVLVGAASLPFVFTAILGDPFTYTNLPFPVCLPEPEENPTAACTAVPPDYKFVPTQPVPMLVGRCYNNPFERATEIVYTVHRRLVSDQNGVQIQIGDTFSTANLGCTMERQVLNAVPAETPPGAYHFEGFSEVHSWKIENVLWRSSSFQVQQGGNPQ